MKHLFFTFAFVLALAILLAAGGQAAHADGGPHIPHPQRVSGPFFTFPVHGPGDLVPNPFKRPAYGNHPTGCFPPLVLNRYGQCALPGDDTPPDPPWHFRAAGFGF